MFKMVKFLELEKSAHMGCSPASRDLKNGGAPGCFDIILFNEIVSGYFRV
jgi:hypothetical protein